MRLSITLLVIVVVSLTFSSDGAQFTARDQPEYVSMLQLVVTPERFDGRLVVVTGFLSLGKEADELYVTQSDERNGILENGVSIVRSAEMRDKKAILDHKYVRVAGRFKLNNRLKARFTSGGFEEVQSCQLWSDPEHPVRDRLKHMPGVDPN